MVGVCREKVLTIPLDEVCKKVFVVPGVEVCKKVSLVPWDESSKAEVFKRGCTELQQGGRETFGWLDIFFIFPLQFFPQIEMSLNTH